MVSSMRRITLHHRMARMASSAAVARGSGNRRAVTLVELLVIISIMVLLTAVAVPAMRPALEGRRAREAARAVNMYLGSARNRAIETGRPCGVMIQRFAGLPQCAMELDQVEVPPPYGGDEITSVANVYIDPTNNAIYAVLFPAISDLTLVASGLVQFDYQGPLYSINGATSQAFTLTDENNQRQQCPCILLTLGLSQAQLLPWASTQPQYTPKRAPSLWKPYKIYRQPVKSHATPLQLPAGTVLDLDWSGFGNTSFSPIDFDTNTPGIQDWPVTVMFSPNGALYQVFHSYMYTDPTTNVTTPKYGPTNVTEPIYLLIGKRERCLGPGVPPQDGRYNWQDLTNLWVTINPQTGLVTTAEVAMARDPATDQEVTNPVKGVPLSRTFARQAQSMGGR